ncbi:MAG: 3-deoxy-D-manno-octulosonic acid transferase [Endomicrobiales bacterium]|nr:3-deoxy-D-manno-octulosonic acid transferase [Endomicrobiales bacterium]
MIYFYNVILLTFVIPAVAFLLVKYRRRLGREFFYRIEERFGFWVKPSGLDSSRKTVWIHSASLGEVKAVEPLVKQLSGKYNVLLTLMTLSGREYVEQKRLGDAVYYVPFDFNFLVKRIFAVVKPECLILVETELWPGLILETHKNGVKVLLVNARLSNRSYPAYRLTRIFWKNLFKSVDKLLARSKEDAERFIRIGCEPSKVSVTGNIKYDNIPGAHPASREGFGFANSDLVLVFGSTRKGEEALLVDSWLDVRRNHPSVKLAIAPRHLARARNIITLLDERKIRYALRSKPSAGGFDCLVLDTFGELNDLYSLCDIAVVGGSFANAGGQNPIEPASHSKPVVFGRHMDNFETEARILEETGGGLRAENAKELASALGELLSDGAKRTSMGRKALEAVNAQKGAMEKTSEAVSSVVG